MVDASTREVGGMTEPCAVCGAERANSPSDYFCSDQCQRDWHARQAVPLVSDVGTWLPTQQARPAQNWRAA
jgi:endogenous inhibitor of DNA gyrase (YacG/DUF329 family)